MLVDLVQGLFHHRSVRKPTSSLSTPAEALEQRALLTVTFKFDYRYDTQNFFNSNARATLERAAGILESRIGDTFDAIAPSGDNTWTANFTNPGTGNQTSLTDLTIRANEILVFPAGRNLGNSTLGRGGWGGYTWRGSSEWGETVEFRGEASNGTDFAPWGGTVAFNNTRDWHFGATVAGLGEDEHDFLGVAVHELGHVLGFAEGNAAYDRLVVNGRFTGSKSVSEYDGSGNVPISSDGNHWAPGTTDAGQAAVMDPFISAGTRELPSFLDWAGWDDIGWDINRAANDYGDAPSNKYPTLASQNGARHNTKSGLYLGSWADGESNAQESDDADGYDDEDGVRFLDTLFAGSTARVDVTANGEGKVNAWIDFNLDGDWEDTGEHVLVDADVDAGIQRFTIDVPASARSGVSYARFRLNSGGGLAPVGAASDGEVEDYAVNVVDGVLAIDDTVTASAMGVTNLNVLSNDLPGQQTQLLSVTQPTNGTVSINADGTVRFEGDGTTGNKTFNYTIGAKQQQFSGAAANDQLGRAIAVDGDTLVVGAPLDDTSGGTDAGSVQVYRRSGSTWNLAQTVTASDGAAGDRFGISVDIDGNTLVIGARLDDDDGTNSGSVYVFNRDDESSQFRESQKILASRGNPRDQFGHSVTIGGNYIAVGIRLDDNGGSNSGSAEVFMRSVEDSNFEFQQRLRPDEVERGDQLGSSVAIVGNTLFVGAWKDHNNGKNDAGAVYVFNRSGSVWNLTKQVLPGKPSNYGYFGFSVAASGSRLAVGQPSLGREARTGRAYVFEQNAGGSNNWGMVRQIDPSNANGGNRFGYSVSISGDRLAVGAIRMANNGRESGDVRVYSRNVGGSNTWGLTRIVAADNAGDDDEYGYAVAITGESLFAGARKEDSGGGNSGAFYFDDLRTDIGRVTVTID